MQKSTGRSDQTAKHGLLNKNNFRQFQTTVSLSRILQSSPAITCVGDPSHPQRVRHAHKNLAKSSAQQAFHPDATTKRPTFVLQDHSIGFWVTSGVSSRCTRGVGRPKVGLHLGCSKKQPDEIETRPPLRTRAPDSRCARKVPQPNRQGAPRGPWGRWAS